MANVVFILGAGASVEGGCPVMKDFFDRARSLYINGELDDIAEEYKLIERIRMRLQRVFSKSSLDINNLEEVFSTIEMGQVVNYLVDLPSADIDRAKPAMLRLIMATLERTQKIRVRKNGNGDLWACGPSGYVELAGLIRTLSTETPSHEIRVVTFNYDTGLEVALETLGMSVSYQGNKKTDNQDGIVATIPFSKLHGSLNWTLHEGKQISAWLARPVAPTLSRILEKPSEARAEHEGTRLLWSQEWKDQADALPFIVPPSENKGVYREQMRGVWQEARQALSDAEVIFVIGYSLPKTDQFFRQFLALSLTSDTLIRHLWIIDPDSSGVSSRFQEILGPAILDDHRIFRPIQCGLAGGLLEIKRLYTETSRLF